jgi:hypothetical protein
MAFNAGILHSLETALSDAFEYHDGLDAFVIRAGVDREQLGRCRGVAEARARTSPSGFSRAPKRFVVQELLNELASQGDPGDRLTSNLITAVLQSNFPAARPTVIEAIGHLRGSLAEDRLRRREEEEARRDAQRRREEEEGRVRERMRLEAEKVRDGLRDRFLQLTNHPDAQRRGYLLQDFLNDFFELEGLDPRRSFMLIGEQIDGSFAWGNRTHLVEAKWVSDPVAGSEFGAFIYKLTGKSPDTRGLYVSVNGYSSQAMVGLKQKGEVKFICIDGAHLIRCFAPGVGLPRLLEALWRHAGETGEAYLPVGRLRV